MKNIIMHTAIVTVGSILVTTLLITTGLITATTIATGTPAIGMAVAIAFPCSLVFMGWAYLISYYTE